MGGENLMEVELKQADGLTLIARGKSNHWVVLDGAAEFEGHDAGSRPMELMLMALGGCSGQDIVSILSKMKVKYDDFKIKINAERASEHPKVFTEIDVEYIIWGNEVNEEQFLKAVDLSITKYCSAAAMLSKVVPINFSHKIVKSAK